MFQPRQIDESILQEYEKQTAQVQFRQIVLASTGIIMSEVCPLTGKCISITFHYPNGCNALVLLRAGIGQIQIIPSNGFIALDNATPPFPVYKDVMLGQRLFVEVQNTDAGNPHTPGIIFDLEGVRKSWSL